MEITQLNMKHFGKFQDKTIECSSGMNIFYGRNESGKSTVFAFIKAILFGLERGRGRAAASDDFSRYEPWENGHYYAGRLRFTSGGKRFCLERNFDRYSKSASLICEDDGEEFSLEHGDLEMLLDGLTAEGYENTIAIGQLKVETNQTLAGELRNYAANYYASGSSEIDLEMALDILRLEKKGVEKTVRNMSDRKQAERARTEQEAAYVWRDLHRLKEEHQSIAAEIDSYEQAEPAVAAEPEVKPRSAAKRLHPLGVVVPLLAIAASIYFIPRPWDYLLAIVLLLAESLYIWNHIKERNNKVDERDQMSVSSDQRNSLEKLRWQQKALEESLREKQIEYDNLQEQLAELDEVGADYKAQDQKKQAIDLAMSKLLKLSGEIHQEVGQNLNARASAILSEITEGKYTRILFGENLEMHILAEGRKVEIGRLSRGTIEQIYFALRVAASEILHEEEYPLILDDTFAYYDDARAARTLQWLAANKKQVLVFTCHQREIQIMDSLGIPYHLCPME